MRHALLAGTAIAAAAGLVGYFLVLRGQVFTGDALSHVAFTGALPRWPSASTRGVGLFAATVAVGVLLGALGRRGRADDVVIGSVFAWMLGPGRALPVDLHHPRAAAATVRRRASVLFGSIFGLTAASAVAAALVVGAPSCVVMVAIARPLLFASLDEAVAAARGVPVRPLGLTFLAVGAAAAEPPRRSGPCSSSACWPRRPGPPPA